MLECSRSIDTSKQVEQSIKSAGSGLQQQQQNDNTIIEVDNLEDNFGDAQFSEEDIREALRKYSTKGANIHPAFATEVLDKSMLLLRELQVETLKCNPPRTVRLLFARFALALFHQHAKDREKCLKCSVCLEVPTEPTVSTVCWHVLCASCWLVTIGNKRLCPQCSSITQPSDLRRIFI